MEVNLQINNCSHSDLAKLSKIMGTNGPVHVITNRLALIKDIKLLARQPEEPTLLEIKQMLDRHLQ